LSLLTTVIIPQKRKNIFGDKMLIAVVKDIPILFLPALELCYQKNGAN
jgi:hypothetical protein